MLKIGLTGGIGTGKSVVAKIFHALGIPVFNADIEAARLMHSSENVKSELIGIFGDEVYDDFGLNRPFLREKLFSDDALRQQVNEIVHPRVRDAFHNFCLENNHSPYVLQEAAILIESGGYKQLDGIIVVSSPESLRIRRVKERDEISEEMVRKIMNKQMPEKEKLAKADYIIYNDEEQLLIDQVYTIHEKIKKQAD